MDAQERDLALLGLLGPDDRAKIEAVVDEVIDESLPTADPDHLQAAAQAFDDRATALPDEEKIVAWQIAAALRLRARKQHRLN